MEENLNNKKVIMVIIIALVVIAAIILAVILLGGKEESKPVDEFKNAGSISSTESEFEALKVKDIELTYKEDGSETIIDFAIHNMTDKKVEKQTIDIQLYGENDALIAGVETYVETIDANSFHKVNMMLAGHIQGIKKIKLVNENPVSEVTENQETPEQ